MGKYRTLLLKYDVVSPETLEKVIQFLKVQKEFRKWVEEWAKNGAPLPQQNPLKYFARQFIHAAKALDWLRSVGSTPKRMRPPLVFDAQLRLNDEKDNSRGVFVNLPKKEVRIRKWSGRRRNTIVLPLSKNAARWIEERVREGGELVLAAAWVGNSRKNRVAAFHTALVFRRDVAPVQPRRLLIVDFNALHNGISYAVIDEKRVLEKGILKPHVTMILHLEKRAAELDALCSQRGDDVICRQAAAAKSRLWRLLRRWEDEAAKKLVKLALQYRAATVADVPDDESMCQLKEGGYAAEKKIFLNYGRLRRRLKGLAGWHGVPYREERLYSTVCPRCGAKMEEMPNRRVKCQCGFEAHRDEVPALWAMKRFHELTQPPSFSATPAFVTATA